MKKVLSDKLAELLSLLKEENMGENDTVLIVVGKAQEDGVECHIGYSGTIKNHIDTMVNLFESEGRQSEVIGRVMFKAVNEYRENHKTCMHPHPDEESSLQMMKRVSANISNDDEKPKKGESLVDFIARAYKGKPESEKKFAMDMAEMITKIIKS